MSIRTRLFAVGSRGAGTGWWGEWSTREEIAMLCSWKASKESAHGGVVEVPECRRRAIVHDGRRYWVISVTRLPELFRSWFAALSVYFKAPPYFSRPKSASCQMLREQRISASQSPPGPPQYTADPGVGSLASLHHLLPYHPSRMSQAPSESIFLFPTCWTLKSCL